eukprot:TRINITY_DN18282_c2_g4_i1.p2 TRINITY_DN18282_c2_g4~~TRINITY_DN18282_c2_g4_i1.p2  ORF type:complete len:136 (+),score=43.37 TRINITY_DN18282_c2_g4_i1:138-545(+)
MGKQLIAELPPMESADLKEFENTVYPWGQQRKVRKNQLAVAGVGGAAGAAFGWVWPVVMRRNTSLVGGLMVLAFGMGGTIAGHSAGLQLYPSVAGNAETTMMRRLWWAKKCSADFEYSFDQAEFSQQYPHVKSVL